jgi:hypothetical protein
MDTAKTHTFADMAAPLAEQGWRPIPLRAATKTPAMTNWNRYNREQWQPDDLLDCISHNYDAAVGIAVPDSNFLLDVDVLHADIAAQLEDLADNILGHTPAKRIGQAPKFVKIYRSDGSTTSRKAHPLEYYSGSGQAAVYGIHNKTRRPYEWPEADLVNIAADSMELPLVTGRLLQRFQGAAAPLIEALRKREPRAGAAGLGRDPQELMDKLLARGLPYRKAAKRVLEAGVIHGRHYSVRAVVSTGYNRGVDADQIYRLVERFAPDDVWQLVTEDGYLERVLADFAPTTIYQGRLNGRNN